MLKKERILHRFFYLEFDPAVLEERKAHRNGLGGIVASLRHLLKGSKGGASRGNGVGFGGLPI
jgi:hypothetical protein